LQELWVSHLNWIPETYDAYVALGICNQVEFIISRQVNSIFECTGNFFYDIVDSLDGWKLTIFTWKMWPCEYKLVTC